MSEPSAKIWLVQADSDLECARRTWQEVDPRTYCQAVAKYQQVVEKSVKAIVSALKEVGVGLPAVGYSHDLERHLAALERLPKRKKHSDLQMLVDAVFTRYHRTEIRAISLLAPTKPVPGRLHRRNTEYPFEIAAGIWVAPAAAGIFERPQVSRFRTLAMYLYVRACRIVGALRI